MSQGQTCPVESACRCLREFRKGLALVWRCCGRTIRTNSRRFATTVSKAGEDPPACDGDAQYVANEA